MKFTIKKYQILHGVLFLFIGMMLTACGQVSSLSEQSLVNSQETINNKITFDKVIDAIKNNEAIKLLGVDFSSPLAPLDYNANFDFTPTGAYINRAVNYQASRQQKLHNMTNAVLDWIGNHPKCKPADGPCTAELKEEYQNNKAVMLNELEQVAKECVDNEMRNHKDFSVFYYGFPAANRLYLDVLRKVRSFENLNDIKNSYLFRDFSFQEGNDQLKKFLQGWWPAYVAYAESQGKNPKTTSADDAGHAVRLTYYPDSIVYAKSNIISANISLFGNNVSLLNNTVFFFLNGRSATDGGSFDQFIHKTLSPYVINADGTVDEARLVSLIAQLNNVFNQYIAKGGGNLAQIFIRNDKVPQVSFLAWNGGEPVWFSHKTNKSIQRIGYNGQVFQPTNVFWPNQSQEDYYLYNLADYQRLYVTSSGVLQSMFPISGETFKTIHYEKNAVHFLNRLNPGQTFKNDPEFKNYRILEQFTSMDLSQARILPANNVFANERVAGVKLYTANPLARDDVEAYERAVDDIINNIFMDFFTKVKGKTELKPGSFPLKTLFEQASKPTPKIKN